MQTLIPCLVALVIFAAIVDVVVFVLWSRADREAAQYETDLLEARRKLANAILQNDRLTQRVADFEGEAKRRAALRSAAVSQGNRTRSARRLGANA